jgi:uncharacterized membrane protein (UPF0127 family)
MKLGTFLKNKNKIYIFVAIIVVVICLFSWYSYVFAPIRDLSKVKTVQIGSATIDVKLALTPAEQVQGLSGQASLATNTGMFFIFEYPSNWNIWMKDMNFSIDVLWIADDFKVSDIVENMAPASYPNAYTSHMPVRYVLEVLAGTVKSNGITVGQNVVLR